jgi:beta-glucosidase
LQGFTRLRLEPGQQQTIQFSLTPEQLSFADENGQWLLEPGEFQVWVGGQQPDLKNILQPKNVLGGRFVIQA